jgi:hypothetical protein
MKVSIGKNTLGGGKKMMTRLNNYNRSTHDLSFVMRTTMAPGVLVPTMKQLVLPGDTFPIQTRCHVLTHPTVGPLFGSFKQQNDFFFCPIRLYNAMLHNNALNIGLDMKKVKFPYIRLTTSNWVDEYLEGSADTLKKEIHPSSLLSYLGYKRFRNEESDQDRSSIQVLPILMYYDIFKNYYANKQEKSFYQIVADGNFIYSTNSTTATNTFYFGLYSKVSAKYSEINKIEKNPPTISYKNPVGTEYYIGFTIQTNQKIDEDTIMLLIKDANFDDRRLYRIQGSLRNLIDTGVITRAGSSTASNTALYILNETKTVAGPGTLEVQVHSFFTIGKVEMQFFGSNYAKYDLSEIDDMREDILANGRTAWEANSPFITAITKTIVDPNKGSGRNGIPATAFPMVGLVLKTYQSDINTNWVNTEWIDGETGINAITAIDTSSGSFTLDTLNLAKKVYTMLNRIAVSDGSYNAWIQTVYTSGGLNHVETPVYLGGSSLEIEFQEVVNNSGTENEPLGALAGRGVASNHKGGNIIFKADEPGYIFCISSITPRVDYFQGNDWDLYLNTMDDLHKPQLDGIGFQDRLYQNINANADIANLKKSIGKQPAWIEYMTNVNKTYGNFALVENEGWMCLNRIFGNIDTYTTYIFPHLYNNIFADTDITAQNFWVQIAFNMKPRRVMSAKVIPNI